MPKAVDLMLIRRRYSTKAQHTNPTAFHNLRK